eukprot:217501-Pelagomonas_calceolata.AAC.1
MSVSLSSPLVMNSLFPLRVALDHLCLGSKNKAALWLQSPPHSNGAGSHVLSVAGHLKFMFDARCMQGLSRSFRFILLASASPGSFLRVSGALSVVYQHLVWIKSSSTRLFFPAHYAHQCFNPCPPFLAFHALSAGILCR